MGEIALFNVNDIAVLFGGFLSLVLSLLLVFFHQEGRIKKCYWVSLAVFFFLGALHTIDILTYWSTDINAFLSAISADFFFLFGFTFFLQGPLLYWFTKAAIYRDFTFKAKYLYHLIPAIIYPFYIYSVYHRFDADYKLQYVHSWTKVIANPYFETLIWAQRLAVFFYSVLSLYKLYQYIRHLKSNYFSPSKVDLQWLKLLLIGFFVISLWGVLSLIESRLTNFGFDSPMGTIESQLNFIYICMLVIYLLQNSKGFSDIKVEHTIGGAPVIVEPHQQLVKKLQTFMEEHKPYLEPHITVERLAAKLQVSPKLLSTAMNSQLHKNFFEIISSYRLEEAKKQLTDPQRQDLSILEIMKNCGFSSKSVFNQAFKKSVGVPPSHYRQQHIG